MALVGEKINKSIPVPLYFQLKELILKAIKSGEYPVGSTIPTENELSQIFTISRTTVRQAITELVQEGWLYREKSKGTFVAQPKINQDFIQKLESFNEQILRSGHRPWTELLEMGERRPPQAVAEALQLPKGETVLYLHRRRYADDEPIVTVETYLPYTLCRFLLEYDMNRTSLYEALDRSEKTRIRYVRRLVEAVAASSADAVNLHIARGKPIQHFLSIGFNSQHEPVEYSLARYRGDRNSFAVTVFRDQ